MQRRPSVLAADARAEPRAPPKQKLLEHRRLRATVERGLRALVAAQIATRLVRDFDDLESACRLRRFISRSLSRVAARSARARGSFARGAPIDVRRR